MSNLQKVEYETALGHVDLDAQTVKNYLVKGGGNVTDQEIVLFMKLCEAQQLNPFVSGEVYLIKFGDYPATTVIGYDTYRKRAESNPEHLYTESGIIVDRGGDIVQKAGACLYPTEKLVGGWAKVHRKRNNVEVPTYVEVTFAEYNTGKSLWKEKPCTMIEKVAISQCLRKAYPKDYEGLYTAEELANGYEGATEVPFTDVTDEEEDPIITNDDRRTLFAKAINTFGEERGKTVLKDCLTELDFDSTTSLTRSQYEDVMKKLDEKIEEENAL